MTGTHATDGTELLWEEVRDEGRRLVSHPVREMSRLEHVAQEGESAATPLIVTLGVTIGIAVLFAVVCAVALTLYYTG